MFHFAFWSLFYFVDGYSSFYAIKTIKKINVQATHCTHCSGAWYAWLYTVRTLIVSYVININLNCFCTRYIRYAIHIMLVSHGMSWYIATIYYLTWYFTLFHCIYKHIRKCTKRLICQWYISIRWTSVRWYISLCHVRRTLLACCMTGCDWQKTKLTYMQVPDFAMYFTACIMLGALY